MNSINNDFFLFEQLHKFNKKIRKSITNSIVVISTKNEIYNKFFVIVNVNISYNIFNNNIVVVEKRTKQIKKKIKKKTFANDIKVNIYIKK